MSDDDRKRAIASVMRHYNPATPVFFHDIPVDERWPTEALIGMIQYLVAREQARMASLAKPL